jgi:hypothetical protein
MEFFAIQQMILEYVIKLKLQNGLSMDYVFQKMNHSLIHTPQVKVQVIG